MLGFTCAMVPLYPLNWSDLFFVFSFFVMWPYMSQFLPRHFELFWTPLLLLLFLLLPVVCGSFICITLYIHAMSATWSISVGVWVSLDIFSGSLYTALRPVSSILGFMPWLYLASPAHLVSLYFIFYILNIDIFHIPIVYAWILFVDVFLYIHICLYALIYILPGWILHWSYLEGIMILYMCFLHASVDAEYMCVHTCMHMYMGIGVMVY